MKIASTVPPDVLVDLVRELVARLIRDVDGGRDSHKALVERAGLDRSMADKYFHRHTAHFPLYFLGSRYIVSDALLEALVAGLRRIRAEQPGGIAAHVSCETSLVALLRTAGEFIAKVGDVLADGVADPAERVALRRIGMTLIAKLQVMVERLADEPFVRAVGGAR